MKSVQEGVLGYDEGAVEKNEYRVLQRTESTEIRTIVENADNSLGYHFACRRKSLIVFHRFE